MWAGKFHKWLDAPYVFAKIFSSKWKDQEAQIGPHVFIAVLSRFVFVYFSSTHAMLFTSSGDVKLVLFDFIMNA